MMIGLGMRIESDCSFLAKMSENLDFGAKSVQTAHDLKKKFISEPYNFRHITHIGISTESYSYNRTTYEEHNNTVDDNNNTMDANNNTTVRPARRFSENEIALRKSKTGSLIRKLEKIEKVDIGNPYDFRHVAHVGLDGFFLDEEGIKCETLTKIMKEAGVTAEQLKDPSTREFIKDFFRKNRDAVMEMQESSKQQLLPAPPATQPFVRSQKGVSASLRVSSTSSTRRHNEEAGCSIDRTVMNLSECGNNIVRPPSKRIAPPKPPRRSLQKSQSMRVAPLNRNSQ